MMTGGGRRDPLAWWLVGGLVLVALSTARLAADLGRPFGGYVAARSLREPAWFVDTITPTWWPALAEAGLPRQARFLDLAGTAYGFDHSAVFARAADSGADRVSLTGRVGPEQLTWQIPVVRFAFWHLVDLKLPYLILSLGFWLLARSVYIARPADPLNRQTAFTFVTAAVFFGLVRSSLFQDEGALNRLLDFVWIGVSWPLLGAALFQFALNFPYPLQRWRGPLAQLSRVSFAVIALAFGVERLAFGVAGWAPWVGQVDERAYFGAVLMLGAGLLVFLIRLIWDSCAPRTPHRARAQARLVALGLAGPVVAFGVWLQGAFGPGAGGLFWGDLDVRALVLTLPLALAFVILRYRAFRSVSGGYLAAFVLTTSGLAAGVANAVWVTGVAAERFPQPFLLMFLAVAAASWLWSRQSLIANWLARRLNWDFATYAAASRFGPQWVAQTPSPALAQQIAETLVTGLEVEGAAVWQWREDGFQLTGQAGAWPAALPARLSPAALPHEVTRLPAHTLAEFDQLPAAALAVPLAGPQTPLAVLALGQRREEEVFTERELDVIRLVAQQVALLLLTGQQLAELRRMSTALHQVQELERRRLAQELHDTVQQSLNGLTYLFTNLRRQIPADPDAAAALSHEGEAEAREALDALLQIRFNLDLHELAHGVTGPLQELSTRLTRRRGVATRLDLGPGVDEALNLAGRTALFRVIQQALENAAQHAQAQTVWVTARCEAGRVWFEVRDDGLGSEASTRAHAQAEGHMGLHSMRARVESVGGQFGFDSQPGLGTTVSGWIPQSTPA